MSYFRLFFQSKILYFFYMSMVVLYVVYQLYAYQLMGSEGVWIFNVDNAYRLTHVWQLIRAETYPPPSLSNLDVSFHYHYAGAAIAAFIVKLTGWPVWSVYFQLLLPVLLILSTCLIFYSVFKATKNIVLAAFSTAFSQLVTVNLSLVSERMINILYEILYSIVGWNNNLILNGFNHADAERFGNGVYDVAYLSFYLITAVIISLLLNFTRVARVRLLLLLAPFFVLIKIESFLIILLCVFAEFFVFLEKKVGVKLVMLLISFLMLAFVSYSYAGFDILIVDSMLSVSISDLSIINNELLIILAFSVLVFIDFFSRTEITYDQKYITSFLFLSFLFFFLTYILSIDVYTKSSEKTYDIIWELWKTKSHVFVVVVIVYMVNAYNYHVRKINVRTIRRAGVFLIVVTVASIYLIFKSYHVGVQLYKIISTPENAHEAAYLKDYRQCLREIPVENSIIYTNSFKYPAEGYRRDGIAMHLTALMGHQGYALNSAYENQDIVIDRVLKQKKYLSNKDGTMKGVCELLKTDKAYILLDKKFLYPSVLEAHSIDVNKTCAVFRYSDKICSNLMR